MSVARKHLGCGQDGNSRWKVAAVTAIAATATVATVVAAATVAVAVAVTAARDRHRPCGRCCCSGRGHCATAAVVAVAEPVALSSNGHCHGDNDVGH